MRMKYFGDSYDIVKQSLIGWLKDFGNWSVHPMLTEGADETEIAAFESFLEARVISREILTKNTNRDLYLSCGACCGNLFLDPDTGLRSQSQARRSPEYLFVEELVRLSEKRPRALTLVFDQSLTRGKERDGMKNKLRSLRAEGVHAFAYVSHACFILGGHDESLVQRAFGEVVAKSRLPAHRLIVLQ